MFYVIDDLWSVFLSAFIALYRQLCLIQTVVDPKFLSSLGKIRIMRMHIGIIRIGRDWDLTICPVETKIRIAHVRIKQSCLYILFLQINIM